MEEEKEDEEHYVNSFVSEFDEKLSSPTFDEGLFWNFMSRKQKLPVNRTPNDKEKEQRRKYRTDYYRYPFEFNRDVLLLDEAMKFFGTADPNLADVLAEKKKQNTAWGMISLGSIEAVVSVVICELLWLWCG